MYIRQDFLSRWKLSHWCGPIARLSVGMVRLTLVSSSMNLCDPIVIISKSTNNPDRWIEWDIV